MQWLPGRNLVGLAVLSVFFAQGALGEEAPTKNPTCVTTACHGSYQKNPVIHKPLKARGCTVCHGINSKSGVLMPVKGQPNHPKMIQIVESKINASCLGCHENLDEEMNRNKNHIGFSIHKPISTQSCITCHNPHSSKQPALLREKKAPDSCYACHKDIAASIKNATSLHLMATEKDACFNCHTSHSSAEGRLLKNKATVLCLECHLKDQKTKDGRVIKNIKADDGKIPNHRGLMTTDCTTCHNPHASVFAHLLKPGPFVFDRLPKIEAKAEECVDCHFKTTPMVSKTWLGSLHAQVGVTCVTCHEVKKDEPGYGHHGTRISMIVSPKLCGTCHKNELTEFAKTSHGMPIAGHELKQTNGKPDGKFWPMPPIGRINPDGSAGTCTVCHARHDFTAEAARQPAVCNSCHLQDGSVDAWTRSAHGAAFGETKKGSNRFATGGDVKVPTCVTCHMSDNGSGGKFTHDVTARLMWKLVGSSGKFAQRSDGESHREAMTDTCTQCHGSTFVENGLARIDDSIKAGIPAKAVPPNATYLIMPGALPHLSPTDRSWLK